MNRLYVLRLLALLTLPMGSLAQFIPLQKLTPQGSEPQTETRFGYSVAVDGPVMVVGAAHENGQEGAAYVYERVNDTWQQTARLVTADRPVYGYGRFGTSVAVSGNTLAIGAVDHDADPDRLATGVVYLYEKIGGTWSQVQRLAASDGLGGDFFGTQVALAGNTLAVGAIRASDFKGAVWVFEKSAGVWSERAKLSHNEGDGQFGISVGAAENALVVGVGIQFTDADGNNPLTNAGAAYVYENVGGTWTKTQKIVPSDRARADRFGRAVAISGGTMVVGAWTKAVTDAQGNNPRSNGAAYVFEKNGPSWQQTAKLLPNDPGFFDAFGISVAVSGGTAVVGARLQDFNATGADSLSNAGAAYVFRKTGNTWASPQKLVAPDRTEEGYFGYDVAVSGNTVLVGANREIRSESNTLLYDEGAAYVFCQPAFGGTPVVTGGPVCAGQAVGLSFEFNCLADATLTAQLSDATGSFANPVSLGAVTPGHNQVVIPPSTPFGTGYRLRVVASNPSLTSEASAPFTVNALGNVAVALYPATPSRICLGDELPVTFSTTGACPFPQGNAFTVQLSNATGSFSSPTTLGAATPGTTSFALPQNLPAGTGYRVRVLSTNPATTSFPSAPFELRYPSLSGVTPGVGGVPQGGICRGNQVTLSFSLPSGGCAFPGGNTFTAQLSSPMGSFTSPVSLGTVQAGVPNPVTIPANSAAGTGYRLRVVSSTPASTSLSSLPFRVNAVGCNSRLSAEEADLVISPNPAMGGEIRVRVSGMDNPQFGLTSASGRSVSVSVQPDGSGEWVLTPKQTLTPGVYAVQASEGATRLTRRVLVVE